MEQLGSNWSDFYEILYFSIFHKKVEKIKVSLKSDKSNKYFTRIQGNIFESISLIF